MRNEANYWIRKRPVSRRRFLAASGVAAAGTAALLAGCGDDDETPAPTPAATEAAATEAAATEAAATEAAATEAATEAATAAATEAAATEAAATEAAAEESGAPVYGGTFRTLYPRDAPTLNVVKESTFATHQPLGLVYNRLLQYTAGPEIPFSSTAIEGDLAQSWEIGADGLEYTFKLADGITWQDAAPVNGRAFTSGDVKYSAEFIADAENLSPSRSLYAAVESIDTPDDSTITFRLAGPRAEFIENIASHYALSFPRELIDGDGLDAAAVGTGSFILESWEPGVGMDLVRNPNYFKAGLPYIDNVEWRVVTDASARTAALRGRQIDVGPYCCGPSLGDVDALTAELSDDYDFVEGIRSNGYFLAMRGGPGDDPRVRKAVSLALQREPILANLYEGRGVMQGHVPHAMETFRLPEATLQEWYGEPDIAAAKANLEAAGYGDGFDMEIVGADNDTASSLSVLVQALLQELGINLSITPVDRATYFARLRDGDFEMISLLGSTSWSLDFWLSQFYRSDGGRNYFNYASAEYDALADRISAEVDTETRVGLSLDAQRMLYDDLPTIPVGQGPQVMPISKNLIGYGEHWSYGMPALEKSWFNA